MRVEEALVDDEWCFFPCLDRLEEEGGEEERESLDASNLRLDCAGGGVLSKGVRRLNE